MVERSVQTLSAVAVLLVSRETVLKRAFAAAMVLALLGSALERVSSTFVVVELYLAASSQASRHARLGPFTVPRIMFKSRRWTPSSLAVLVAAVALLGASAACALAA